MEIPKELYNEALDIARLILSEDAKEKIKRYKLDTVKNRVLNKWMPKIQLEKSQTSIFDFMN